MSEERFRTKQVTIRVYVHTNGYPYAEIRGGAGYYSDDNRGFELSGIIDAADATAIAVAVNSHDDLFDALEALMRRLDAHFGGRDASEDWKEQEQARTVLDKKKMGEAT